MPAVSEFSRLVQKFEFTGKVYDKTICAWGGGCTCRHACVHARTEANNYGNTGNAKGGNGDRSLLRVCENHILKARLCTPILVECRLGRYAWRFVAVSYQIDFRGILVMWCGLRRQVFSYMSNRCDELFADHVKVLHFLSNRKLKRSWKLH